MMADLPAATEANFDDEVIKAQLPVLLDFWAPWCAPCLALGPSVEKIADEYAAKLKVMKVNVDENPGLAGRFNILSIPTLLLFRDGQEKDRIVGLVPEAEIRKRVDAQQP
jgi:thioredoxin 1